MKPVTVKCPKCEESSDLYLGADAFMIILNCPSCQTPLVYYYGRTSEVTQVELERIQKSGLVGTAGNLLKEISDCGIRLQTAKTIKPFQPARESGVRNRTVPNLHGAGKPVRAGYFSKDDMLNLRIELETCTNISEFLERI